jgi:D-3-phosphoglycerate dehydrogenase / 2-oxoglutarate reductase
VVCDPGFPLDVVHESVPSAEMGSVADAPADTVALLVTPTTPVSSNDMDRLPDLRLISTASTGFDHIDLAAAESHDVRVRAVGNYSTEEVADHTIALVTGLLRGIPFAVAATRQGGWDYATARPVRRISGSRLAVVGYGHIGQAVAERARALGMEVRYHDPFQEGGEPQLDPLLEWADVVTLHLALSERTARIIDRRRLDLMRPGAILVNTARGPLVDREALLSATHIRAGLDHVWEMPPRSDLLSASHIVITPYMAWYSDVTEVLPYRRAAEVVAEELSSSAASG